MILFFYGTRLCFYSLHNGEHSNRLVAAAFSNKSFSGKKSVLVKNSYLLTFPDDKAEILVVVLSKLYWDLFYSVLLLIALILSLKLSSHQYDKLFVLKWEDYSVRIISLETTVLWSLTSTLVRLTFQQLQKCNSRY